MYPQTPETIETVAQLEDLLSDPPETVVDVMSRLKGDILVLGAGGKIGPSLARMAKRASDIAGAKRRIIGVSRFNGTRQEENLQKHGVETIRCDLLDEAAVAELPEVENVVFMAGLKFGSTGNEAATWAMNAFLPGVVCKRFRSSRIVAFSTGAIYGLSPLVLGGARETDAPDPVGEYSMSCLGRERVLEYFSRKESIPMALVRLFYACELRYGVLVDLAQKVLASETIDLAMGHFNIIWQGDNNAMALRALEHTSAPPLVLNVTGPELLSVRDVAETFGRSMGREPIFAGEEWETSCIGNATVMREMFGAPHITAPQLIAWVADWVLRGGECLGKPTHFEARHGRY